MIRTGCVLGIALIAFGAGMIFSVLLSAGLCAVILGIVSLIGGAVLLSGNGA